MIIKNGVLLKVTAEDISNGLCVIPEHITAIGKGAFSDHRTTLTQVNLPDSISSIGAGAFWGCSNLESINLPGSIVDIGDGVFWGCTNLKHINLPDSIANIGENAFRMCENLSSLNLPDNLTSIRKNAFRGCKNLTHIRISGGVSSIGQEAFHGCENLTSLRIPDSVRSIGNRAFRGCIRLASIQMSGNLRSIGEGVFMGCSNLNTIAPNKTSDYNREHKKIKKLLPAELKSKLITKTFYARLIKIQEKAIKRLKDTAEVSGLFRFFYRHEKPQTTLPALPIEILTRITEHEGKNNRYIKKAMDLIDELPLPQPEKGLSDYKKSIKGIIDEVRRQAKAFNSNKETIVPKGPGS